MPHYITAEGLLALQNELQDILSVQLPAVVKSIESALKDGDIKENSPLAASKERRDELLIRQGQIEEVLTDYQIIKQAADNSKVRIGSTITITSNSSNTISTYRIVGGSETNPSNGAISDESPLGVALLGHKIKDIINFKTPSGIIAITLNKIE